MGEVLFITDSAPALAGHALGPTAPEMLLGALASCLVHTYLIQATLLQIPLDNVEVEVKGALDMSGVVGLPYTALPQLSEVTYSAKVTSPAAPEDIADACGGGRDLPGAQHAAPAYARAAHLGGKQRCARYTGTIGATVL